jgi:hypothetical protein
LIIREDGVYSSPLKILGKSAKKWSPSIVSILVIGTTVSLVSISTFSAA